MQTKQGSRISEVGVCYHEAMSRGSLPLAFSAGTKSIPSQLHRILMTQMKGRGTSYLTSRIA